MKVYIDVVFFLNFMYDLILLMVTGLERKLYPSFYRLLMGALLGTISMISLFIPFSILFLSILKFSISIFMILSCFSYRNKNFFYQNMKSFYENAIILGGLVYFLNTQLSSIFSNTKTNLSLFLILLPSPIIFYFYRKKKKQQTTKTKLFHQLDIIYSDHTFSHQAYLDTGNTITDPYKKRKIIILKEKNYYPTIEEAILVPYQTVGHQGLLRCIKPEKLLLDQKEIPPNYLIGFSEENINMYGADCILPSDFVKEIEI